ncbi:MAG: flagellar biosynthesis anti-sigma factor FlgM [Nevskia sp.]|nr:flagellar biosynthesis anti-sigma factor FlgM [Nevskia sp.]
MTPKIDSLGTAAAGLSNPVKSSGPAAGTTATTSVATSSPAAPAAPTPPVDKVSLTGDAVRLQQLDRSTAGSSSEPQVDSKRVSSLRSAIASGRYKVDAKAVASKLTRMEWDLAGS